MLARCHTHKHTSLLLKITERRFKSQINSPPGPAIHATVVQIKFHNKHSIIPGTGTPWYVNVEKKMHPILLFWIDFSPYTNLDNSSLEDRYWTSISSNWWQDGEVKRKSERL